MKFSNPRLLSVLNEFRGFSSNSRPVYAAIPALINYSIWAIGGAWSIALNTEPVVPSEARPIFLIGTTFFSYLLVFLWSKSRLRKTNSSAWYLEYFAIVMMAMTPTLVTLATYLHMAAVDFIGMCLRLILLVSVAESIVGFLVFRVNMRTKELEEHQISLVEYEEKFLSSVHNHFHDNVQTKLFGIGIQLNQIRMNLEKNDSEHLSSIISEIESIRKSEVRKFGSEFTPEIFAQGLIPSIVKRFASSSSTLVFKLHDDLKKPLSSAEEELYGLGIYRITEQAVINSIIHGQATRVDLRIYRRLSKLHVEITNDGKSLKKGKLSQGHGFAVIDGWVSKLNGTWTISNVRNLVSLRLSFK